MQRNNLLMHLNAGDSTSYPASGTIWYDLSGNGENGTLTNGPTYDNSTYKSIVFDGSNDYVAVGAIAGDFTAFTVTAWFNATTIANYRNIIDCNNNIYTSGNVGPRLEINAAGNLNWIISGNTSDNNIYDTFTLISSGMSSNPLLLIDIYIYIELFSVNYHKRITVLGLQDSQVFITPFLI